MESLIEEVQAPSFEGIETSTVNLAAARRCVDWMVVAIVHLNERAGFEVQIAAWIHDLVITSATQAAILWSHRLSEQARISLFHSWLDQSLVLKPSSNLIENWDEMYAIRNRLVHGLLDSSDKGLLPSELDREFLLIFGLAVTEKVRAKTLESQAPIPAKRIRSAPGRTNAETNAFNGGRYTVNRYFCLPGVRFAMKGSPCSSCAQFGILRHALFAIVSGYGDLANCMSLTVPVGWKENQAQERLGACLQTRCTG